ncbi:MAG: shikimate dehydrogenase [Flavobacteriaceae bacterium]|nr:shikimate dehydrogenase [Flavobacteriaceae bacterium]
MEARTKHKYGLIGKKLGHSFSKKYFEEKFVHLQLSDFEYHNLEIDTTDALSELRKTHTDFEGFNVTIPYKQAIIEILDELDEHAKNIAAVNTIKIQQGRWIGFNTDYIGFTHALNDYLPLRRPKALILGTGGASKAIAYALQQLHISYELVSSTRPDFLNYKDLNSTLLQDIGLVVNTTPLGMYPSVDTFPPIPYKQLLNHCLLFDLVYNPPLTRFMQYGNQFGLITTNGYKMLVAQAEAAWKIWHKD